MNQVGYHGAMGSVPPDALARLLDELRPGTDTPGHFRDRNARGVVLPKGEARALVAFTACPGPKIDLARRAGRLDTIGADLVNRLVNDVLAAGATPLLFVLHVGTDRCDAAVLEDVMAGVAKGCRGGYLPLVDAGLSETPTTYGTGVCDLFGTIVGSAPADRRLDGSAITGGDVILCLPSTGLHSDGYPEAARALEVLGLGPDDELPGAGTTVRKALLAVHKSYRGVLLEPIARGWLHGAAHVGAGGLRGSLERAMPEGRRAALDPEAWPVPPLFSTIASAAGLADTERDRVFNMGIGMALIVPPRHADDVRHWMDLWHEPCHPIGRIN